MIDEEAWAYGVYVSHAVAMIGKHQFPTKPLDIFGVEQVVQDIDDNEPKPERADGFRAFAFVWNLERKKKLDALKQQEGEVKDNA